MAIGWTTGQRTKVEISLQGHPVDSGQCAVAAREILPVATERDPQARPRIIEIDRRNFPKGRYVSPTRKWFHHVTVEVEGHHIDALTGADGHPRESYLLRYFPETAVALIVQDVDLNRTDL